MLQTPQLRRPRSTRLFENNNITSRCARRVFTLGRANRFFLLWVEIEIPYETVISAIETLRFTWTAADVYHAGAAWGQKENATWRRMPQSK
jgi:hypothetical protein